MSEKIKLGILSVFLTIDGEANVYGPGCWSVFVRTRGCTVGCHWCDTKYSWSGKGGLDVSVSELVKIVSHIGLDVRKVTLTGGEPLEQSWPALFLFLRFLIEKNYHITIETAGTQDTIRFRKGLAIGWPMLDTGFHNLSFVVDYKLQSSMFKGIMDMHHFERLRHGDVVKFVIDSDADLQEAYSVAHHLHSSPGFGARMYFSPSHNKMTPALLMGKMRTLGLSQIGVGFNMQMHKYIWPEDSRTEENTGLDFTKRSLGRDKFLRLIREAE